MLKLASGKRRMSAGEAPSGATTFTSMPSNSRIRVTSRDVVAVAEAECGGTEDVGAQALAGGRGVPAGHSARTIW